MRRILLAALLLSFVPTPSEAQPIFAGFRPKIVTQLPTCNAGRKGRTYPVTDATSSAVLGAGGGSVAVIVQCDGTATYTIVGSGGGAETNDLEATAPANILTTEMLIGTGSGTAAFAPMSGDATMDNAGALTIGGDVILESMFKAVDAPADEECFTYESTTGDFEWQACGSGAAFSGITGSTNTTAAMLVGTGASLGPTGTGTIDATGYDVLGLTTDAVPDTSADYFVFHDTTEGVENKVLIDDALGEAGVESGPATTVPEVVLWDGDATVGSKATSAGDWTEMQTALGTISGDATVAAGGSLTISADAIEEGMLKAVDTAVDEECLTYEVTTGDFEWQSCGAGSETNDLEGDAPANILTTEILIGTGSGTAAFAAMGGDVTMSNAGVVTIGGLAVTTSKINNSAVTTAKIANNSILEEDLKAVDTAVDEECLTYEVTTGDFEWQSCGAGAETNDLETDGAANIANTELAIGTGAGTVNYVAMSGDATLSNAGLFQLGADVVDTGEIAADAVGWTEADLSETVAGNPALALKEGWFLTPSTLTVVGGWIFEGETADANEFQLNVPVGDWTEAGGDVVESVRHTGVPIVSADIEDTQHSVAWSVWSLSADGTQCADPAEVTINSGPLVPTIICTDNAASIFYGTIPMPDGWDGGTLTFELQALNTAADTNVLDFDFSAQCRGDGDAVNSTWGTAQNASITFTTANDIEHATTAALTADGTCAAGDALFWRAVMDDTATTTAVATAHVTGIKMEYTGSVDDE